MHQKKNQNEIGKVSISEKLSLFNKYWNPKIVGRLNGQEVRIAKLKGEFVWHKHENEDEMFYVLSRKLKIEFLDKTIELMENEFLVIPKGVEHKPVADEEFEMFCDFSLIHLS